MKKLIAMIALIALIALPTVSSASNMAEALVGAMKRKAGEALQTEKKAEPFKLNGLYIGQNHGEKKTEGAGSIIMNMLIRSNMENHPAMIQITMQMIAQDFNWLYGLKGKFLTYKGFNMVLCDRNDKVVAIFLGGYDADLDRPELIPEPPEGKPLASLKEIAKRFKDLQGIESEPKYGYLPNQANKAAYWILDDCAVFVFDNLTIEMFKKTDKLLKSISPVPVNKNRPQKKKKPQKPKFQQVNI